MDVRQLIDTAGALVAGDSGLPAIDVSNLTCDKRFAALAVLPIEEDRRGNREPGVTTPRMGKYSAAMERA